MTDSAEIIRPKLTPQARIQTDRVSGKPVLLYPEGVLNLNPTGTAILELCDEVRTLAEIVTLLAERYGAPADQLAPDVIEYLERLQARRIVDLAAPPAPTDTETPQLNLDLN